MADGIFYMPISNYKKFVYNTIVGFYEDWKISRLEQEWDKKKNIKELKYSFVNPVE